MVSFWCAALACMYQYLYFKDQIVFGESGEICRGYVQSTKLNAFYFLTGENGLDAEWKYVST